MANRDDRRTWPVRVTSLDHNARQDLLDTTTAEQRLAMMWPLARDAWALMGRPLPTYTRVEAPVRVVALRDA